MANPILPHPNMDFTPLDVLTAAELDQMVANIQYLTNFCKGLANGSNLDNGSVLPLKLNWSDLVGNNFQTGTVSATFYPSGNTSTKSVTFPKRFKNTPLFFAQHYSNTFGELYIVTVSSVSTTGATLRCRTNHNQSVNSQVMWCAIGETA